METGTMFIYVSDNFQHTAAYFKRNVTNDEASRTTTRKEMWDTLDQEAAGLVGGCFISREHFIPDDKPVTAPFCDYCHTRHFGYQDHYLS